MTSENILSASLADTYPTSPWQSRCDVLTIELLGRRFPWLFAAARRLGHANASVTTRHYDRSIDAQIAEYLDKLGRRPTDAQRAPTTEQAR